MSDKIGVRHTKVTGTLENWWKRRISLDMFVLMGDCFGDTRGRFPDGYNIHTSAINERECKEGDVVTTMNSTYKLGKKLLLIDAE